MLCEEIEEYFGLNIEEETKDELDALEILAKFNNYEINISFFESNKYLSIEFIVEVYKVKYKIKMMEINNIEILIANKSYKNCDSLLEFVNILKRLI